MVDDLRWAWTVWAAACGWLATATVLAARRRPGPGELAGWARRHGLTDLDREQGRLVERYLRRSRWFRTLGGAVPFLAATLPYALWASIRGLPTPAALHALGPRSWLGGYMLGVLVAEYTWPRPHPATVRSAALAPRRLVDYLPAWVIAAQRLTALATVALVAAVAWLPVTPAAAGLHGALLTGREGALANAAVAVGSVLAVESLLRRVVRRPQPVTTAESLAVDDALRSTSIHAAAGAGLAVVLLTLSLQLDLLAASTRIHPAASAAAWLTWAGVAAALASWVRVGHPRWAPVRLRLPRARAGTGGA